MTAPPTTRPSSEVVSAARIAEAVGNPPPTAEQTLVIEAPADEPLLVVAGAGSGKTETMASRVVWLVANGHVDPDQVLGLTFTRKAASELAERIGKRLARLEASGLWTPRLLDDGDEGAEALGGIPVVSTYHSYAGRLVREHALRLGYEPESRLLSEAAAWQYAAEAVARYDGDMDEVTSAESTIVAAVTDLAGELAEHLLEPEDVVDHLDAVEAAWDLLARGTTRLRKFPLSAELAALRNRRAILPMVRDYLDLKRRRDAMDFSDQMALAARLAHEVPSVGAVERQRFRAVLLDEFQDTSHAQMVLLSALYAGSPDRPGEGVGVTAVGDPNQSIYGWRGASATTLEQFRTAFATGGGLTPRLPLSTSWRNDVLILAAANGSSAPLRDNASVPVEPLRARPGAGEGDIEVGRFPTTEEEAAHVAAWVAARWRRPSGTRTRETAAVLCRKRSQFPLVVEALRAADLPVEVVGLGGLLLTPEVSDLVSLLWVVQDPSRGDRLMRLLTGPLCRLGAADLDGLATWARDQQREPRGASVVALPGLEIEAPAHFDDPGEESGDGRDADETGMAVVPPADVARDQAPESSERASIVEALDDLPRPGWHGHDDQTISEPGLARLHGLSRTIRDLRGLTALPLADLVGEAERALGLDIEVLARPEHTPTTARAHLDAFADVAASFSAQADRPTLLGFLAWIDAAVEKERGLDTPTIETSADAVQVLTIHAAKGLEWDHVAVPGLVEGSFPAREGGAVSKVVDGEWAVSPLTDKGWLVGAEGVPYDLRGDRAGLPRLPWDSAVDWEDLRAGYADYLEEGGRHALAEERRLAYVAFTRARRSMLLTAPVWGDPLSPRVTSPFLLELLDPALALPVRTVAWADLPPTDEDVSNPRTAQPRQEPWPTDPSSRRRAELAGAVDRVTAAMQAIAATGPEGGRDRAGTDARSDPLPDPLLDPLLEPETARDLALLLRERDLVRRPRETEVEVPRHLTASAVVQLASDRERFATQLRRPMPSEPAHAARRGTAFHAWIEEHFAQAAMVDVLDLPGSADDDAGDDAELGRMKSLFLASEWAGRVPEAIETSVETVLDGIAIRGRLDAVFPRDDGGYTIVDWKTGAQPSGPDARHRALQLGAYALAYARLRGLPPSKVDGVFYYASTGTTVAPRMPREKQLLELLRGIPEV